MKILLKRDSHLFNYEKTYGSTTDFSSTLSLDAGFLDTQPNGDVECTAYTASKVGSGATGQRYDIQRLWSDMVSAGKATNAGAMPRDAFAQAVSGLRVMPSGEKVKPFNAYFQTELGEFDFFTNVKSAIQMEHNKGFKRPVGCGTFWYAEWGGVLPNGVMPEGKTHTSDHEWMVCGWDAEHPEMFKIDSHEGYYKYMPRNVFNKAMDATYGSVALTFAQTSEEVIEANKNIKIGIGQKLIDALYNLIKLLQAKLSSQQQPSVSVPLPVPPIEIIETKYKWNTPNDAKHSVRVLCDELGVDFDGKNIITACIQQESRFNTKAIGKPNSNGTTDWGLCQFNDGTYLHNGIKSPIWIGQGADFPSTQFVLDNPEKCVRVMIREYKAGHISKWSSYSTGAYKQWL